MKPSELPLAASSRASALAWAFRFDGGGRAEPISEDEKIHLDCPDGGFIWCHLDLVHTRVAEWLSSAAVLPKTAVRMLMQPAHSQLDYGDGFVWGTILDFARDLDKTSEDIGQLHFVVGDTLMITGRRRHLEAVDALRLAVTEGARIEAPIDLFEQVMERVIDAHTALVAQISDTFNEIEDRVLEDAIHDERRRLGPLRRKAAHLHRQLTGIRVIFQRLDLAPEKSLSADLRVLASRLLQRVDSLHHEVHSFQERARLLHEEIAAKLATETNRNLYILTVLATALMPPTFVTGMFGMNVKGLLFADDEHGFLFAMLMCLASALAVFIPLRWLRR
jgi:Mg2+ and Co2+ transporter CorA